MSGTITAITKACTLATLLGLAVWIKPRNQQDELVLLSLFILSPLLCLANFWQQYHVLLALPLALLLAIAIQRKSPWLMILVIVTASATSLQEAWYQDTLQQGLSPVNFTQAIKFQQLHPSLDAFLFCFPFLWLLARLRDLVFLVPLLLFCALSLVYGISPKANTDNAA